MVVYLPIFALTGVEGKIVHQWPSPWSSLFGAMILSVTFIPAAVALFAKRRGEGEPATGLAGRPHLASR